MSNYRESIIKFGVLPLLALFLGAGCGGEGDSAGSASSASSAAGGNSSSGGAMGGAGGEGAGSQGGGQTTTSSTTSSSSGMGGAGAAGSGGSGGSGGSAVASMLSTVFDGADEWVDLGDVYDFSDTTPFSVFLWLKTTKFQDHFLVGKRLLDMNKTGWQIALNGLPPRIAIDIQENTKSRIDVTVSTKVPFDGKWHQVGFTYNGSGMAGGSIIYLDGLPLAGEVHADTLKGSFNTVAPFTFGAKGGTGKWLEGNMDEVTVYAASLSAAEVLDLHNGGTPTDPSKLPTAGNVVGWWKMGDGDTFPTIFDHGPFSYDGTMTNMEAGDFVADTPP